MEVQTLLPLSPTQLRRMRRGTHCAFMRQLLTYLRKYSTEHLAYLDRLHQFEEALAAESRLLGLPRGSECSIQLHEADETRCCLYQSFKHFVMGYASLPALDEYQPATQIKNIIQQCKLNLKATFRQKSGVFTALLHALQSEENLRAIESLGLTKVLNQMVEQNRRVGELYVARSQDMGARVPAALSKARARTDRACVRMLQFMQSMCVFLEDAKLAEIIAVCNVEIREAVAESRSRKKASKVVENKAQPCRAQQQGEAAVSPVREVQHRVGEESSSVAIHTASSETGSALPKSALNLPVLFLSDKALTLMRTEGALSSCVNEPASQTAVSNVDKQQSVRFTPDVT